LKLYFLFVGACVAFCKDGLGSQCIFY